MPDGPVDTTNAATVKLWAKKTWYDWRMRSSWFNPANGFTGDDPESFPIVEVNDFEGGPGDEITYTLLHLIGGRGAIGAEQLEGREQVQDFSTFKMKVDIQRNAVKVPGAKINPQRVPWKVMKESSRALRSWADQRREVTIANHMCGNSRQTDLAYTGLNTVNEPDSRHIYRVGSGLGASNDQSLTSSNVFDVDIIPELINAAETQDPPMKPWIYKGNPYWGMWLHPNVIQAMRKSSAKWYDEARAALQGGKVDNNPIFSRALGMKHNVLLFSEISLTQGKNSSTSAAVPNTRRNVFFGAGAIMIGYGVLSKESGDTDRLSWTSAATDFGMKLYTALDWTWGVKTIRFADQTNTPRDLGRIVVVSYAAEQPFPYIVPAGPLGSYIESYDKGQPQ